MTKAIFPTFGRCECGAPVAAAKNHRYRGPIRCENCQQFVIRINSLRHRKKIVTGGRCECGAPVESPYRSTRRRCENCRKFVRHFQSLVRLEMQQREINSMDKIPCACGCGTLIAPVNVKGRPARFVFRHAQRTAGARNGNWRGGKTTNKLGYVLVHVGADHPMARNEKPYVLEHRLVMSDAIGRTLSSNGSVHHINGDRSDNRLENLQLRYGHHGPGAAYRCCDCGSHNVEPTQLIDSESGQTHLVLGGDQ